VTARLAPDSEGGRAIAGYRFTLGCPRCGCALEHVTSGTPGLGTRAVARCGRCGRHWRITVTLDDVTPFIANAPNKHAKPRKQATA
jgi:hypothetical protein